MGKDRDKIIHGPASVQVDGTDVGYTRGGVTVRHNDEKLDIEADQLIGVIDKKRTMERMFVSFTMLQSEVANMITAMQGSSAGSGDVDFGNTEAEVTEHALTVTGPAPDGNTRTYTFYRATVAEDVEHLAGSRDTVSEIPVTFELMKDPSNGNKFGYFSDA